MAIYSGKPREIKFLLIEVEMCNINRKHLKQFEKWLYWKMSKSSRKNGEPSVMGAFSSKKNPTIIGIGNEPDTSQHFHPWFGSSQNAANKIHMHETDCQHDEFWRHGAIWTDLPLETKQEGEHQQPERLLQMEDNGQSSCKVNLDAHCWPRSHCTALLGWMYKILMAQYVSMVRLSCDHRAQLRGCAFKRSIFRSNVTQENLLWQVAPVWIFWCLIATEHTLSCFSFIKALPGFPSSSWLCVFR